MVRMPAVAALLGLAVFLGQFSGPARAQDAATAPSAILTVDPERLFEATAFGQRVIAEVEQRADALQTENRRIEADLIAEERDLTERRPGLPVDEFRTLADAFDAKVDGIRSEQERKAREIQEARDAGQQEFFNLIGPVLLGIVRERRAAVLLDRRAVFLSADTVDITETAIARIDREVGAAGTGGGASPEAPGNEE